MTGGSPDPRYHIVKLILLVLGIALLPGCRGGSHTPPEDPLPRIVGLTPSGGLLGDLGSQVTFELLTEGTPATRWTWEFGEGATLDDPAVARPVATMSAWGIWQGRVRAGNRYGWSGWHNFEYRVGAFSEVPVISDIRFSPNAVVGGISELLATATNRPVSWRWALGDSTSPGGVVTEAIPTIRPLKSMVSGIVVAINEAGESAPVEFNLPVGPGFGGFPAALGVLPCEGSVGEPGELTQFTAMDAGRPLSWNWDFGGGAIPNLTSGWRPIVELGAAGTYRGTLTVARSTAEHAVEFQYTVGAVAPPRMAVEWTVPFGGEFESGPAVQVVRPTELGVDVIVANARFSSRPGPGRCAADLFGTPDPLVLGHYDQHGNWLGNQVLAAPASFPGSPFPRFAGLHTLTEPSGEWWLIGRFVGRFVLANSQDDLDGPSFSSGGTDLILLRYSQDNRLLATSRVSRSANSFDADEFAGGFDADGGLLIAATLGADRNDPLSIFAVDAMANLSLITTVPAMGLKRVDLVGGELVLQSRVPGGGDADQIRRVGLDGEEREVWSLDGGSVGRSFQPLIRPSGDLVLAGRAFPTLDLDPGPGGTWLNTNEAFVASYSRSGVLQWAHRNTGGGRRIVENEQGDLAMLTLAESGVADLGLQGIPSVRTIGSAAEYWLTTLLTDGSIEVKLVGQSSSPGTLLDLAFRDDEAIYGFLSAAGGAFFSGTYSPDDAGNLLWKLELTP